jgi:hypothetical protein
VITSIFNEIIIIITIVINAKLTALFCILFVLCCCFCLLTRANFVIGLYDVKFAHKQTRIELNNEQL